MSEIISTAPLEQGDDIALATNVDYAHAYAAGRPGDVVTLVVPAGRGVVFEWWLRRQLFAARNGRAAALGKLHGQQTAAFTTPEEAS